MKQVVIGINKNGEPYVVIAPKKVEVIFKADKAPTWRKRYRRMIYRMKCLLG